jgi:hypothetical protein
VPPKAAHGKNPEPNVGQGYSDVLRSIVADDRDGETSKVSGTVAGPLESPGAQMISVGPLRVASW